MHNRGDRPEPEYRSSRGGPRDLEGAQPQERPASGRSLSGARSARGLAACTQAAFAALAWSPEGRMVALRVLMESFP